MAQRRDIARRRRANLLMVRLERGYTKALHGYQRKTGRLVAAAIRGDVWAYGHVDEVEDIITERQAGLEQLIRTWMKRVVFLFGPEVIENLQQRAGVPALERKDALSIWTESVLLWLNDYALRQATTIAGTMKEAARGALIEAFEEGLGEREAAKRLRAKVGGSVSSARRIARTEVHTAASVGSDEAARATGLDMVKEWASTEDSRTRPTHDDADGQRREMDEPFEVGGAALDYPGDPKGPAREVINCRCTTLYHPRINGQVFD